MNEKKFKQYKVYVKDEEVKESVIKHGWLLGYEMNREAWEKEESNVEHYFLFFWGDESICEGNSFKTFKGSTEYQELYPHQFLALTPEDVLEQPEPEEVRVWDIEPGDLVLARDENSKWEAVAFSHPLKKNFVAASLVWDYVAKYTPALKKYIGTSDEIPGAWGLDDLEEIRKQIEEQENRAEIRIEDLRVGDKVHVKAPRDKKFVGYLSMTGEIEEIFENGYIDVSFKGIKNIWSFKVEDVIEHYPQKYTAPVQYKGRLLTIGDRVTLKKRYDTKKMCDITSMGYITELSSNLFQIDTEEDWWSYEKIIEHYPQKYKPELTVKWLRENLKVGDEVKLKTLEEYEKIEERKTEILNPMRPYMGKKGKVIEIDADGINDEVFVLINFSDSSWMYQLNVIAEHYPQEIKEQD